MSFKTYEVRVYDNGTKCWYLSGKRHREDGPAIEWASGSKEWYLNGKEHREDGPAYERFDGTKKWWLNGKLHRVDGPAVERADGNKRWYLNGEPLTKEEFDKRMNPDTFLLSSEVALWQLSTQCEETTTVGPCCDGKVVEIDGKKYRLIGVK